MPAPTHAATQSNSLTKPLANANRPEIRMIAITMMSKTLMPNRVMASFSHCAVSGPIPVSSRTRHFRRVARCVTDGMNNDLGFSRFVKDEKRVGGYQQPLDTGIVRASADVGTPQQEFGERLDAGLDPPRALRRVSCDVVQNRVQIGESR